MPILLKVPLPGIAVQFVVTQGGGQVNPATFLTFNDGTAETEWTLGPVGPQKVVASAAGSPFSVEFNATAT